MKSCALLLLLSCWLPVDEEEARVWTDASGKFSVEATLVESKNGIVVLNKTDGSRIEVPLNRLSKDDQKYLREWVRQKYNRRRSTNESDDRDTSEVAGQFPVSTEWPSWRGADRTGVSRETGLMKSWPAAGPPLLWTAEGLGNGMSSVVVADGKIFTMGKIDGQQCMVALSTDGQMLWKTPFSGDGDPNCTPTYDDGMVYGLGRNGKLVAVQGADGTVVWTVDFPSEFGGRMMSGWGYSESPLIDGDRLICTPGGEQAMMVALDKKTGKLIWKTPMRNGGSQGQDGAGYSSIVIGNAGGIRQYVTLVGRGVIGVEAETGRPLWHYPRVANGTANVPTPIVHENLVFCSSGYGDGGSALLQLNRQGNGIAVREVYYLRANEVQNHHGGMVLIDDHVYMGHGHNKGFPLCLELRTGRVKWGGRIRGAGDGSAAIVAADGQIYFRYEDGKMALVEANPQRYQLNGEFQLPIRNGKSWPHPVVVDGRMYIRCQNQLACFNIKAD